jgi:ADP-ribosyl-[dinitrogen reductase] hydrolase
LRAPLQWLGGRSMTSRRYAPRMLPVRERLEGGILGLLVGDALGVPFEFSSPGDIPPRSEIDFDPPLGFSRAHEGIPPGTYSDDGAHALCLLASLLHCQRLDVEDFGRRLRNWYSWGYLAVDNIVFDVGVQTAMAIRALEEGVPAAMAGRCDERGNGNGSLMRVLPLALVHRGSDLALVRDAHDQSAVTHGHRRAQVCCALYVLWARRVLADMENPWSDAVATLRAIYRNDTAAADELESSIRPDDEGVVRGTGYVVDSLRSARWACGQGGYEDVVRAAVSLGNDTDTTAAIAGGIAGLRDGVAAIPSGWRGRLRGREEYGPLIAQLLEAADRGLLTD